MVKQLKKIIVDNLYESNFYGALINIQKLEANSPNNQEVPFYYYYLYSLMEWVCKHKNYKSSKAISKNKKYFFNIILNDNKNDKTKTYLQLYLFLNDNFKNFDNFSWFDKDKKSIFLLEQALKEDQNNLDAKFYLLFAQKNIDECFEFLSKYKLNIQLVKKFLNNFWFRKEFLEDCQKIRQLYNIDSENDDFLYHVQTKDYEWLYEYFNKSEERKSKITCISYGKVCFELEKFDEAIQYYQNKKNKKNDDYFLLGKCYEKQKQKQKAIECYKNYYINFNSGYTDIGIKKLFELEAYVEIELILKNEKSHLDENIKKFYKAKLLNIKKKYDNSISTLDSILDNPNNNINLKKDIYLLYISNYFNLILKHIKKMYDHVLSKKDFELNGTFWFDYKNLHLYHEMKRYTKKLNIEYNSEFIKNTDLYLKKLNMFYISKIKMLYRNSNKLNVPLTEGRELYYLSAFKDLNSLDTRISIFSNKIEQEKENPEYYLELGKLHYQKANLTKKDFGEAIKYLEKSIELAKKYFMYLNGVAELLLIEIESSKKSKKILFDKSIKDFIFYNSYQKNANTIFFIRALYKYKSLSINTLSSLLDNYLYFSSPKQLNDPFDVASEKLEKNFTDLELQKNDFKLFSLSQTNNNKLMWSHYAKEHTGICIGYKFLYLPKYVGKDEVKYRNTNLVENEIFNNIIDYWTVKSEDWEYEKEVRLLHYGNKEKIHYTYDVNEAFEKNIIALQIESIIFGLKFQNETILKPIILEIEKKQNKTINIYKTKIYDQKLIIENYNTNKINDKK